jgi:hypothetical protein
LEEDEHAKAQELVANDNEQDDNDPRIYSMRPYINNIHNTGGELFYRSNKEQDVPANSKEFLNNLLVELHHQ